MSEWLWRVSTVAVGKIVAWLIIAILTSTGIGVGILSFWEHLKIAPWPVLTLVYLGIAALLLFVIGLVFALLYAPIGPGTFGSKYLLWYKNPIRKISWKFDQILGGSCGRGIPVRIDAFQAEFKVNRGEGITPKKAFLECKTTGEYQDVLISISGENFVKAEDVAFLPKGHWFKCRSQLGGINKELLLQKYDGFTFVFEYDQQIFRRHFSRRELEEWIDRFCSYSNPPPEARGVLRAE